MKMIYDDRAVIPSIQPREHTGGGVEPHCSTCICGKRAPVQGEHFMQTPTGRRAVPAGTVTWAEHLEAYEAYAARFGKGQSAERLAERGGFGYWEITDLLGHEPTTWSVR